MTVTPMHRARIDAVCQVLAELRAGSVLDLGCGDGPLLARLAASAQIERIVGIERDAAALARLAARLEHDPAGRAVELRVGDLLAPDPALAGFDVAVLVEVIEHIDPTRLSVLETALFATLRPRAVILTTPNADFNGLLGVPRRRLRHPEHRFEWGRARFRSWARGVGQRRGQTVAFRDLGGAHPDLGGPSQMAVFRASAPRR